MRLPISLPVGGCELESCVKFATNCNGGANTQPLIGSEPRGPGRDRDVPRQPSPDEILAATAHELRLPLSHIKGFVSSLRRTDVTWNAETSQEFLAEIDRETDRLVDLVDSLCTPRSSAQRGYASDPRHMPLTPVPNLAPTRPATVVHGALERVRSLPGERALHLDLPPNLPHIHMDAPQMERVLANLIQNAVKHSPSCAAIGISVRLTDDGEMELAVEDEGPGIAADEGARIFEPFFRGRAARQAGESGCGLGLAICWSIVQAHGGRIEVSNRLGGGARFSIFLRDAGQPLQYEIGSPHEV